MAITGRPPEPFDQVVADALCELLAEGWSLRRAIHEGSGQIQDEQGNDIMMPSMRVFFRWVRELESFREQYARAKEEAADAKFEELDEVAEEAIKAADLADPRAAGAVVQAHRLKADNLKWAMSKLKPKKYGDKLDLTSDGKRIKQSPLIVSQIQARGTSAGAEAETTASS